MMRLVFLLALLAASPVGATCLPFDQALTVLRQNYGEVPLFAGRTSDSVFVIVADAGGTTFTLLSISPDGQACPVAAGQKWMIMPGVPASDEKKG